jgi:hypothetical protein
MTNNSSEWLKSLLIVAALSAVFLISTWTFVRYHHRTPEISTIDGTYISACCRPIHIKGGIVRYDRAAAHIELIYDKFGLVGRLDRPLGPFFVVEAGGRSPVSFVFEKNGSFSTVDSSGRDRSFNRVRDNPSNFGGNILSTPNGHQAPDRH